MPPVAYESRRKPDGSYTAEVPEHPAERTRRELNERYRDYHRYYWLLGQRHDTAKGRGHAFAVLAVVLGILAVVAPSFAWTFGYAAVMSLIVSLGAFWQASRYLKAWRSLRPPMPEHRT